MSTIGTRIKEAREKSALSQTDMADRIGVSKQTLYKYENDIITNIPSDKIEAISRITGVSPAYIMGWDTLATNNVSYVPETIAAHFEGKKFSEEALDDIARFIDFVASKEKGNAND